MSENKPAELELLPCEICGCEQCICHGMQTYAMSQYPGEYSMVPAHPNSPSRELFFKKEDVDKLLNTRASTPHAETEKLVRAAAVEISSGRMITIKLIESTILKHITPPMEQPQ